jgi:hypothetical protein
VKVPDFAATCNELYDTSKASPEKVNDVGRVESGDVEMPA